MYFYIQMYRHITKYFRKTIASNISDQHHKQNENPLESSGSNDIQQSIILQSNSDPSLKEIQVISLSSTTLPPFSIIIINTINNITITSTIINIIIKTVINTIISVTCAVEYVGKWQCNK